MNLELLKEYAEISKTIALLEKQKEEKKDLVLASLKENAVDTYRSEFGTFSIGTRKTYKYTEVTDRLVEAVKISKKLEEENGTAEVKETEYLTFR
jgi:hypothetical protein